MTTQTIETIKACCTEEGECWIWNGGCGNKGRPQVRHDGKVAYVRRLVRILIDSNDLPAGKQVPAKCGNKLCVSPHCSVITDTKGRTKLAAEKGSFNRPDRIRRMAMTLRAKSDISPERIEIARKHVGTAKAAAQAANLSLSYTKSIRSGKARQEYSNNPFLGLMR